MKPNLNIHMKLRKRVLTYWNLLNLEQQWMELKSDVLIIIRYIFNNGFIFLPKTNIPTIYIDIYKYILYLFSPKKLHSV